MPIVLLAWRPMAQGSRLGFATVQLGALKIIDVSVLSSNGKSWVSLPSKPLVSGKNVLLDERGKTRYVPILEWRDRHTADRFSASVVAAILAAHGPAALDLPA
jgi:hypothetical protein